MRGHRERSTTISFLSYDFRWRFRKLHAGKFRYAIQQLFTRWSLEIFLQLLQEVFGERHSRECCPRFELTVHILGNVANLDHRRHVTSLLSSESHVEIVSCPVARSAIDRQDYGVGSGFQHSAIPNFISDEVTLEVDLWTRTGKRQAAEKTSAAC